MPISTQFVLSLLATLLVAGKTYANASVTSSTTVVQQPKKEGRSWSGFFNFSRSTNLYDFDDGSRRDGMDYMMRINLKINNKYSLRAQGGYSQDLKYPESNDFSDTSLNLQQSPSNWGKYLMGGFRLGLGIPTSKDSHIRQNLYASVSTGLTLIANPDLLPKDLEIAGTLSLGRNFHQYETALDGRVNTQYSTSQSLGLTYNFNSKLSLSTTFMQRNTWSYQNVVRHSFDISEELSYQFNSTWVASLGHSNSGSTLRPNGADSNIQFFNDNNSFVYASTTVIF